MLKSKPPVSKPPMPKCWTLSACYGTCSRCGEPYSLAHLPGVGRAFCGACCPLCTESAESTESKPPEKRAKRTTSSAKVMGKRAKRVGKRAKRNGCTTIPRSPQTLLAKSTLLATSRAKRSPSTLLAKVGAKLAKSGGPKLSELELISPRGLTSPTQIRRL